MKQKITGFLRDSLVQYFKPYGKTLQKAVQIITSPCCELTGTVNIPDCGEGGSYSFTITTNESIGFLGKGVVIVIIDNIVYTGVVTEPNEIFVENVSVVAGDYDVNIVLFLPTNSDGTVGASKRFTVADVTFLPCV